MPAQRRALLIVIVAIWVLGIFSPVHAFAHARHFHAVDTAPAASVERSIRSPVNSVVQADSAEKLVSVGVSAHLDIETDREPASGCGDTGCCANGPCGGCSGVIAPKSPVLMIASVNVLRPDRYSWPTAVPLPDAPPRPPKTFV